MSPNSKILLGCLIGVISSATQSIGITLQRKSHIVEDLLPSEHHRPPYRRPLWRIGFFLFLIANLLGSSIQITTLPLIILSPLQAIGLVFNSICASVILQEGFTKGSVIGTALVAVGALLIAAFGSIEDPDHSLSELLQLLRRDEFLCWFSLSLAFIGTILLWINVVKLIHSERLAINFVQYNSVIRSVLDFPIEKFKFYKGCAYGVVSGTLSAHSLLLAKSAVGLIINSLVKHKFDNFKNVKSWILIAFFFVLAITQLVFLNKGLRNVSTSVLYPLVFCVYNITNILNGLIFYDQFHVLSNFQVFMITFGTIFVLLGVFSLSWRLDEDADRDGEHRKSLLTERQLLLSPTLEEDASGYVSFGSPKNDSFNGIENEEPQDPFGSPSPIQPFRYGSIADGNGLQGIKGKRRSKRLLSYEQNELLNQLKNLPDVIN